MVILEVFIVIFENLGGPEVNEKEKFFDAHAKKWDESLNSVDFNSISKILKRAQFESRDQVLDVGGGTGVLIPFLKQLGISNVKVENLGNSQDRDRPGTP